MVLFCCVWDVEENVELPGIAIECNVMTTKSKLIREDVLEILRSHNGLLRERFGVTEILLFGSFARDEATEGSDVNVVVEFDETPSWHVFFGANSALHRGYLRTLGGSGAFGQYPKGASNIRRGRFDQGLKWMDEANVQQRCCMNPGLR